MRIIGKEGRGVVVLLRSTRPSFVTDVLKQRLEGHSGEDADRRRVKEYGVGAQILLDLGLKDMVLLTDTPEKKVRAVRDLKRRGYRPLPLRRVLIPKSGGRVRPLGIPVMKDRAMQALYLLALDPVAETIADPNS